MTPPALPLRFIPPKDALWGVHRIGHVTESREGMEPMDRNERTVDFSPEVLEELRRRITPFLLRAYPEPEPLYAKLAAWLGVDRSWLLLTGGADGGLRSVFETFVEPEDEVVCAAPSYAMYPVYCSLAGATYREVRFDEALSLPLERILAQLSKKTKLVVLANPNQPIERVYSQGETVRLLKSCEEHGALLVMDEAYHPFYPESALPYVRGYGNLVVVRSFSKAFGLAGLRLGYLVSRPENIKHLNKVRPMYETNSIAIAAGLYLLENDHLMRRYVEEVRQTVSHLVSALNPLGLEAFGRWSNSVLIRLPAVLPADALAGALKNRGFLVRTETEPPLSNHLRITVGSRDQAERFLSALEGALAGEKVRESAL